MTRAPPRAHIYRRVARIGKAVASPVRLEILEILAQGERSVEVTATEVRQSVANTSHHLRALRAARLVDARKKGQHVFYRLAHPEVFALCSAIRVLAEDQDREVQRLVRAYFGSRDQLEPVTREELLARARAGDVTVLDVRPIAEYRAGHIPGAVSIPLTEIGKRIAELPADREIVAYCRGPYCVLAFQAVSLLRARGRSARRLIEGFPEWRAAGLPVDASRTGG